MQVEKLVPVMARRTLGRRCFAVLLTGEKDSLRIFSKRSEYPEYFVFTLLKGQTSVCVNLENSVREIKSPSYRH